MHRQKHVPPGFMSRTGYPSSLKSSGRFWSKTQSRGRTRVCADGPSITRTMAAVSHASVTEQAHVSRRAQRDAGAWERRVRGGGGHRGGLLSRGSGVTHSPRGPVMRADVGMGE